MKIFSAFDTQLKQKYVWEYTEKFWKDKVFVVQRSELYFYYKVVIRILSWIGLHIFFMLSIYYLIGEKSMIDYGFWIWLLFWLIFYIIALENYIDYTMNYAIFTPDEAILVEQIGIFNRNIKSLDIKKIKSIGTKKSNIFFSIFNDGIITILSDGHENLWEIRFKYVHDPEYTKEQIHNIILQSPHREDYHNNHSL